MRLAYLTSRYPAPPHAFIQREVVGLRELGVEIDMFSLRRSRPEEVLTDLDREEFQRTWAIQPPRVARLLADHVAALVSAPRRYVSTLAGALRLATGGPRAVLWQLFYFAEAVHLQRELARRGLRNMHVHFGNPAAEVAMHAVRFGGPGWSWSLTLHGPAEFEDVRGLHLARKLREATRVACVSQWTRDQARALLPPGEDAHLVVVGHGIDAAQWRVLEREAMPGGRLRIVTIGRLAEAKAQSVLVEAVALLRDRGVDAEAVVIGEGPERAALERLIGERGLAGRARLEGVVGQDRVPAYFADADVFCLPSLRESFGVVLLEAMASGLPVVAARVGGVPEVVDDGRTGMLVDPGDPVALADALQRIATEPDLAATLAAAARAEVEQRFALSSKLEEKRAFLEAAHSP